jgi:F0F1-type ATP synthase assembly protein I
MMDRDSWALVGRYLSLATLLPATTFVGYLIGYLLDKALGTTWLYLVFLLLGIASGMFQLIRTLQKDSRRGGL